MNGTSPWRAFFSIGSYSPENQTTLFLPLQVNFLPKCDIEASMNDCSYHGNDTFADLYMAVFVLPTRQPNCTQQMKGG